MIWLTITIIAYLLLAIVNLIDKLLIDKVLPSSSLYASLVSIMGGLVIIAAPWFIEWPGLIPWTSDIVAGMLFTFALWLMFEALKYGDASKVTVLIGSLIPVFTLAWSLIVKHDKFSTNELVGIGLLLSGALVLALIRSGSSDKLFRNFILGIILAVSASLVYAAHFIIIKSVYDSQAFASAFIWRGFGGAIAGGLFLFNKSVRNQFKSAVFGSNESTQAKFKHQQLLIIGAQLCGALGFILQSYAISLKSVVIINAMQGVQYVILFALGWMMTKLMPQYFQEDLSKLQIAKKTTAIILTAMGIMLVTWV